MAPKETPGSDLFINFSREQLLSHFWDCFFTDFWWKIDEQIDALFQICAQFFQHDDGLHLCTSAVFLALFRFFIFCNLWKNDPKNCAKQVAEKTSKNKAHGVPELIQNGSEFTEKNHENRQNSTQNQSSGADFDNCLGRRKTFPGGSGTPRVVPKGHIVWSLGSSGGYGGINKDNPAIGYLTRHWADGPANY